MEGARVRMVSIIRIFMLFTNCSGSSRPEININVGNGQAGDAASTFGRKQNKDKYYQKCCFPIHDYPSSSN